MTHARKFFSGSMAVVLISSVSAGCAGNGLKGMFSRNETSGYKTLEELEAERIAKEASAEEGAPRFASWLPFGKSSPNPSEDVAANSTEDSDEEKQVSSLWRNPFRRQETADSDPFLSKESPSEAVVAADKPATAAVKASASRGLEKKDVSADIAKDGTKEASVKAASHTAPTEQTEPDDELVDRFEKHFVQKNAKPANEIEEADPLITASKDPKKAAAKAARRESRPSDTSGDDQLLEFEKLLAEKKASAAQKKNSAKAVVQGAADEFADGVLAIDAAAAKAAAAEPSVEAVSDKTVDSFDSLLAAADSERPETPRPSKARTRTVKPVVAQDIEVADQEGLFGPVPNSSVHRGDDGEEAVPGTEWASQSPKTGGFAWPDAKTGTRGASKAAARTVTKSDEDQFASMFSDARRQETPPAATLPDDPETGVWSSAPTPRPVGAMSSGKKGAVRAVSSGRTIAGDSPIENASALAPVSPTLTGTTSESQVVAAGHSVESENSSEDSSTSGQSTMGSGLTIRMLVLLVGGIIVVALLFAPARKKPIHANQLPAQG